MVGTAARATKQLSVFRLPSVLVIHLARFDARGNKVSFIVQMLSVDGTTAAFRWQLSVDGACPCPFCML